MFRHFAIYLLIFCLNSELSLADNEEYENSSLNGKAMSIRILRHDRLSWYVKKDRLSWYVKKDEKLLRMVERGRQINRIMKRDGQLSRNYQRDGQLYRNYQRDGQLSRSYQRDGQFKISERIPKSQSLF